MARFAQYAMVASEEALEDAGWSPKKEEDLIATVGSLPYVKYDATNKQKRASIWDLVSEAWMTYMIPQWLTKRV